MIVNTGPSYYHRKVLWYNICKTSTFLHVLFKSTFLWKYLEKFSLWLLSLSSFTEKCFNITHENRCVFICMQCSQLIKRTQNVKIRTPNRPIFQQKNRPKTDPQGAKNRPIDKYTRVFRILSFKYLNSYQYTLFLNFKYHIFFILKNIIYSLS